MSETFTPLPGFKAMHCMPFKHRQSGKEVRRKNRRPFSLCSKSPLRSHAAGPD